MSTLEQLQQLDTQIQSRIIGQKNLINRLLIALLADGHLLVEGAPGLAKTRAIKSLGDALEGDFHRVQFTPDLLPADLTGTEIYRPQEGTFNFQKGPLFHNLVLADEINRAPAKVQSALLEAMAERQITVGSQTWALPELFLVMATQNPLEQEGTYPLPEAQLDRFLLQVNIDYPDSADELTILRLAREEADSQHKDKTQVQLTQETLFSARDQVLAVHMSESIEAYIVELIMATREPGRYGDDLARWLAYGASPRATIALDRTARAHAWLAGKDYVGPEDVQALSHDVLRHRLILNYEAEAEGVSVEQIIDELIDRVAIP
ncbi:MAG: MoxR family ATPase [Gammaproteobacteria bacterium]